MTVRRASDKERRKLGVAWRISSRRKKPINGSSSPPAAPWSHEAIAAADAAALARDLPPLVAFNLRRLERGKLRGFFDIYVVHWHQRICGCCWFADQRYEWIRLPKRQWTDRSGVTHYDDTVVFDQLYAARFEDAALEALHRLLARAEAVAKSASEDDETPQRPRRNGAAVHVEGDVDDIPF